MKTFWQTDVQQAKAHEKELATLKKLAALLENSIRTGRIDAVLRHIVAEHQEVRILLAALAKSLPRKKQEPERVAA